MPLDLKNIHYLFIVLFLLSYLYKSILYLADKKESFLNYKKKTIVVESVLALGFLVTGVIMLIQNQKFSSGQWLGANGWMHIKLTLVVLAIPLGIFGFKKGNKILVGVSVIFFLYVLLLALPQTRNLVAPFLSH